MVKAVISYRVAETAQAKEDIYRLRYKIYLSEGAISENSDLILKDEYDSSGNHILCGLFEDENLIGSVRLHLIECKNSISPANSVFPKEISSYLKKSGKILDPNRLCLARTDKKGNRERLMSLLKLPFMAAQYFDVDYVTATSRPEHMRLYKRIFSGTEIAEPKEYPTMLLLHGLMISNFQENMSNILNRVPSFQSSEMERKAVFDMHLNNQS